MIDFLVIGAGPAGLAAARAAGELGLRVAVVDENPTAGGQYYRLPALPGSTPDRRQAEGRAAIERAAAVAQLRLGCSVVALEPSAVGLRAWLDRAGELEWVSPRMVLLATGAYDTPVAFPGWTLPGVMSAGAAQALVKGQRVRPGSRAVVAGSGPFIFAVADTLRHAGVSVVEVVEAAPMRRAARHLPAAMRHLGRSRELAGYVLPLIARGTVVRTGQVIAAAAGVDRLEAVRIRGRGAPAAPATSASVGHVVEADLLCVGYGFSASTELARLAGASLAPDAGLGQLVPAADAWQMTSRPGLFIAGEASGLGGAAVAEAEGELAAIGAARHVGRLDDGAAATAAAPVRKRLAGLRDFAALLPLIFPRPDEIGFLADPDTLVCRCENVSLGTVLAAVEQGRVRSLNELKATTRCGQGWCQGRICGIVLPAVVSAHDAGFDAMTPWTARVPIRPVGLAAIAAQVRDADAHDASTSAT